MYPKSVYLDYASSSNERYITLEGYNAIKELIAQHQVCGTCRNLIDKADHLLVGKNLCLACVLKNHPDMQFLGPVGVDSDGDYTYAFLNEEGIIYTITANTNEELRKDLFGSITKAGFTVPEYYTPFKGDKNNPIKLGRYNWTVYGKLTSSVIVLEYSDTYPNIKVAFLSYKDGEVVELNKRNLAYKQMFERAKQVIERTKHVKWGDDYYNHPDGYEVQRITDSMLYPIIAQFEAAVWDVQKAFMPEYKQPEPVEATPQPLQVEEPLQDTEPEPLQVEQEEEHNDSEAKIDELEVIQPQESAPIEPDQAEQIEQETLSVADSVPEETPTPELSDTNVPKSRKRGRLSLVSQEEQTNG